MAVMGTFVSPWGTVIEWDETGAHHETGLTPAQYSGSNVDASNVGHNAIYGRGATTPTISQQTDDDWNTKNVSSNEPLLQSKDQRREAYAAGAAPEVYAPKGYVPSQADIAATYNSIRNAGGSATQAEQFILQNYGDTAAQYIPDLQAQYQNLLEQYQGQGGNPYATGSTSQGFVNAGMLSPEAQAAMAAGKYGAFSTGLGQNYEAGSMMDMGPQAGSATWWQQDADGKIRQYQAGTAGGAIQQTTAPTFNTWQEMEANWNADDWIHQAAPVVIGAMGLYGMGQAGMLGGAGSGATAAEMDAIMGGSLGGSTGAGGFFAPGAIAPGSMFTAADLAAATASFNPVSALAAQGLTAAEITALGYNAAEAAAAVAAQNAITSGVVDAGMTTIYPSAPGTVPPVVPPGTVPPGGKPPIVPLPGPGGLLTTPIAGGITLKDLIPIGTTIIAGNEQNKTNKEIADQNNATQQKALDQAKEMSKFKPVGTRFGQSKFQYDANGNLISAGYDLSPDIAAYREQMLGMMPGMLQQYQNAFGQSAPLGLAGARAMQLGQGYLATSPQEQAAKYMAEQQALLAPYRERELSGLQNKLAQQGRLGLATGGTSTGLMAANPDMEAFYNAKRMQDLNLAAQATQGGQQYAQFGAGLMGTGANLYRDMYGMQTAARSPFDSALGGATTLEGLGQNTLDYSMNMQARTGAAGVNLANLARGIQQPQQVNPWATGLLSLGNAFSRMQTPTNTTQQQLQNIGYQQPRQEIMDYSDWNFAPSEQKNIWDW